MDEVSFRGFSSLPLLFRGILGVAASDDHCSSLVAAAAAAAVILG